jgi:hypothetical protein
MPRDVWNVTFDPPAITPAQYNAGRAAHAASVVPDARAPQGRPRVRIDEACVCVVCGDGYMTRAGTNGKLRQTCGRKCAGVMRKSTRKRKAV